MHFLLNIFFNICETRFLSQHPVKRVWLKFLGDGVFVGGQKVDATRSMRPPPTSQSGLDAHTAPIRQLLLNEMHSSVQMAVAAVCESACGTHHPFVI